MKKLFAFIAVFGLLMMGTSFVAVAQDQATDESTTIVDEVVDTTIAEEVVEVAPVVEEVEEAGGLSVLHKNLKTRI
mgnify:CR=1 FL=1